jgi:hypothetical protein
MALSGLFERASRTSAFGGKAVMPRPRSTVCVLNWMELLCLGSGGPFYSFPPALIRACSNRDLSLGKTSKRLRSEAKQTSNYVEKSPLMTQSGHASD